MRARFSAMCLVVGAVAAPGIAAAEPMTVGAQAGFWNAEAEWRSGSGPFVAAGFPWAFYAIEALNDAENIVALEAKVGWEFSLSNAFALRAGPRVLWVRSESDPCGTGCTEASTGSWGLAEVGLRYAGPSGFVAGLDVPVLALKDLDGNTRIPGEWWQAVGFTQLWAGWNWDL